MHWSRKILPSILATFTGARYLPEIKWSYKSWTHNIFRFYELIFWRKVGIRAEEITEVLFVSGKKVREVHTIRSFEAFCAFIETYIRNLLDFKIYLPIRIWIPKLAILNIAPSPFMFAIALDATTADRADGAGHTFAKTCTGSNLILFLGNIEGNGGDHPTTASYNSVAMTQDTNSPIDGTVAAGDFWMLVGPATGSNNVTNSSSPNASYIWGVAASYSGVAQTGQPDSSGKSTNSTTVSTTVVASNCWLAGCAGNEADAGLAAAPSSDRTDRNSIRDIRNNGLNQFGGVFFDSNGTVATGAQSTTLTGTGTRWANIAVSFAPAAAIPSTVVVNHFFSLLGIGT